MKKNIKQATASFLITAIQVFIIVFIIEWIYRGSFSLTFEWFKVNTRPFWYNYMLLFLLFGSFQVFNRKLYILFSFITSVILFILALACNIKQAIRGEPVLPSDLFLGAEATNMVNVFSSSLLIQLIISFGIILILVGYLIYKIPNHTNRNWVKTISAILIILSFILVYNIEKSDQKSFLKVKSNISNNVWIQSETYQKNGVVASFVLNMGWLELEVPENYTKKTIENIISNYQVPESKPSQKPDIIMIMSEAFWDPNVLRNLEFNKDPLPYFHKLQEGHTTGQLHVPVFGGSTANTEFEALTGISTQLLPAGSLPYLHYVNKSIPALPYLLKEQGYDTTAIHTFHHWFYNRSTVYQKLGFNRFISMEYLENPVPVGPYIHDSNITDEILKKLALTPDLPNFIFAVTTQNHGPYSETEKMLFANIDIKYNKSKNGLSKESVNMLEVYSDNLTEADRELERLITELEKRDRKTMVIFFGDHLPFLGENFKVYEENDFYKDNKSYEQYLDMYSTPFVIWDNFSGKRENLNIGSTMLSPIILEYAGLKGNYLTDYLYSQYHSGEISRIVRRDFLYKENIKDYTLDEVKLLQYDMLFGNSYGYDKKKLEPNNNYLLGYGNPKIMDVTIEKEQSETMLHLKGENFTGYSNVYINGKKVDHIKVDSSNLKVPYIGSSGTIEIVIKISDSYDKVLSESQSYQFEV
jgi:phosphoglycerol transferase MdoB-like AlkP superfamily enzyme